MWHDTSLHLGGSVQHSLSPMDADTGGDGTTMELEFRRAPVNIAQIPKFNELDMCAVSARADPRAAYAALPPSSLDCPGGTLTVRARYTSKSSPRRTPT